MGPEARRLASTISVAGAGGGQREGEGAVLRRVGGFGSVHRPQEPPENTMAESKFAQFIIARKLDPRRILAVSHRLEGLQPEDRTIRLNKRRARKAGSDGADNAPKETRKPRSGRPVTPRALDAAVRGGELSGPTKTRILQAINHLLELKKQEKVDLRALF
jgi:hypothetical protein